MRRLRQDKEEEKIRKKQFEKGKKKKRKIEKKSWEGRGILVGGRN